MKEARLYRMFIFTLAGAAFLAASLSLVFAAAQWDPFKAFPKAGTKAKPGEFVLAPPYERLEEAEKKKVEDITFIFYNQKMDTPGDKWSKVNYTFGGAKDIPNYMIIPIPAGGKAKKGDVVLTWWQSGSGMQRGYVVDASNPGEPVVKYLDLEYDNPAKNRDGVPIGQMSEKLKPNSFVKVSGKFAPGTAVAAMDGTRYVHAHVVNVAGDKVLTVGFAGKMKVYDKAKCVSLDIVPKVKAKDKVQIPAVGSFRNGTVTKVDAAIGRVFVEYKWGSKTETKAVSFGDVATGLVVD